jgi:hypothetical protein
MLTLTNGNAVNAYLSDQLLLLSFRCLDTFLFKIGRVVTMCPILQALSSHSFRCLITPRAIKVPTQVWG